MLIGFQRESTDKYLVLQEFWLRPVVLELVGQGEGVRGGGTGKIEGPDFKIGAIGGHKVDAHILPIGVGVEGNFEAGSSSLYLDDSYLNACD